MTTSMMQVAEAAVTATGAEIDHDQREFRHKIGDALYDLWEWDGFGPETMRFPIVKRTALYAYIAGPLLADRGSLIRFRVAELEQDGRAWNAANRMLAYTRPLPHWPLMPAEVRAPERLAIT